VSTPDSAAEGRAWVAALPAELDGQRRLLTGLLDWCATDPRTSWLVLGCSVARGAGDRLSDLDMALGVRDADFPAVVPDVHGAVDGLARLVESYRHQLPGVTVPHERIFAQYADRTQVDLVVYPDTQDYRTIPRVVVLFDRGAPPAAPPDPAARLPVTPAVVREWAFHGWCALADLGKYLRRGSLWEALNRLHDARAELWRLRALAAQVPDPRYGVTSLLDFAPATVTPELAGTVATLDPASLLTAARRLADLLTEAGERLPPDHQAALPTAMARYITDDLTTLAGS
jgi:hypothetical protein